MVHVFVQKLIVMSEFSLKIFTCVVFKYFFVVVGYIIFMSDMLHELGFFCALFS